MDQFRRAEKDSADLVVRALSADARELVASPVLFNAPPSAEVDLTIPAEEAEPPTLFERIGVVLNPLVEDVKVADLEEDQQHQALPFLSGETGLTRDVLARFVLAHKLIQHGIQAEFWFAVLSDPFFKFADNQSLQDQLASILDSLPSLDAAAVRKALSRSFNLKEISEALQNNVADWVE